MQVDGFVIEADPFDGPGHSFWRDGFTDSPTRGIGGYKTASYLYQLLESLQGTRSIGSILQIM